MRQTTFAGRGLRECGARGGASLGAISPARTSTPRGRRSFAQPRRVVLKAVVSALESEGFKVPVVNANTGLVKTDRRDIRATAVGGRGYATAVMYTRQYTVHVTAEGGQTVVRAEPRIYAGDTDISDRAIWVMSGPEGEPVALGPALPRRLGGAARRRAPGRLGPAGAVDRKSVRPPRRAWRVGREAATPRSTSTKVLPVSECSCKSGGSRLPRPLMHRLGGQGGMPMSTETILIILVLVLVLGGGGYWWGPWRR